MRHLSLVTRVGYQRWSGFALGHTIGRPRLLPVVVILACMLFPAAGVATTWHVPGDAPTIQAGIDSASTGDDVLVGPGTYFEHDIVMKAGVTVHSEQGPATTTVDANGVGTGFVCKYLDQMVTIEGFTIVNGHAQGPAGEDRHGGGVRAIESSLLLRDCSITGCSADNDGGGVFAYLALNVEIDACTITDCFAEGRGGGICALGWNPGETVRITDCVFLRNQSAWSGGLLAYAPEVTIVGCVASGNRASYGAPGGIGCGGEVLAVRDCVIINNTANPYMIAGGLLVEQGTGTIVGCTVAHNEGGGGGGIEIVGESDIAIDRTISVFNGGTGLSCSGSQVTVRCCDLYGNTGGDDICGDDQGGNFSADPLFCDAEEGDYTLDGCSPCLPGNHPDGVDCGLIGALGQGCGATVVEETSWGRIKSLYRR